MNLSIREAIKSDCLTLLEWRNDPSVSMNSFNSDKINRAEHEAWFEEKLLNANSFIFIAELEGNECGMVRYDILEDNSAKVSIIVAPSYQGKGLGSLLLLESEKKLLVSSKVRLIKAEVKEDNIASQKIFIKSDYIKKDNGFEKEV